MSFARLMEEFSILFKTHHLPYRYNDVDRNGYFWLLICASTFVDTHSRHLQIALRWQNMVYFFTRFVSNKSTRCYFSQFYMSIRGDITVERFGEHSERRAQPATPATFQNV